jgi:hypothetical protein
LSASVESVIEDDVAEGGRVASSVDECVVVLGAEPRSGYGSVWEFAE